MMLTESLDATKLMPEQRPQVIERIWRRAPPLPRETNGILNSAPADLHSRTRRRNVLRTKGTAGSRPRDVRCGLSTMCLSVADSPQGHVVLGRSGIGRS
jgi:hypothetical protein